MVDHETAQTSIDAGSSFSQEEKKDAFPPAHGKQMRRVIAWLLGCEEKLFAEM